jgi:hypothetical protein
VSQETIILKPRGQRAEKISGRFFTVLSATAKFTVELGDRVRREVRAGSKISGEPFKHILFLETEGVTNTVVYDAGDAEYQGEVQVSGVSNETFEYAYLMAVDGSVLTIANNSGAFTALPLIVAVATVNYTRKSFHLASRSSDNPIGIYATTGELLDIHAAGTDRTYFFTQDVKLRGTGSASACALYYNLYNTPPQ